LAALQLTHSFMWIKLSWPRRKERKKERNEEKLQNFFLQSTFSLQHVLLDRINYTNCGYIASSRYGTLMSLWITERKNCRGQEVGILPYNFLWPLNLALHLMDFLVQTDLSSVHCATIWREIERERGQFVLFVFSTCLHLCKQLPWNSFLGPKIRCKHSRLVLSRHVEYLSCKNS
jgi:hypothetical protein